MYPVSTAEGGLSRAFRAVGSATLLLLGSSMLGCVGDETGQLLHRSNGSTDEADLSESNESAAPEGDLHAPTEYAGSDRVEGDSVLEGDILLSESELQGIASATGAVTLWPSGVVYYQLDPTFPKPERFRQAADVWELKTGIRFVLRANQPNYVQVSTGKGCASGVGMLGGRQPLWLAAGCDVGAAIHELGHTVGLWHEQSRIDRDDYVDILVENIAPGHGHNFDKRNFNSIGPYDLGSIMHYGSTAFSKNGKSPTLLSKDGSPVIPNRSVLSDKDIAGIAKLYADQKLPAARVKLPGGNVMKNTDPLNLRSGPSSNDAVIVVIPLGSTLLLTGKSQNGYLSVTYAGKNGWAYGQYLTKD